MSAVFSDCRRYRYLLKRDFGLVGDSGTCVFVMLNPSTADEVENDPTVTRCINFAKRWGYSALTVANIYALRSTDPKGLWQVDDPVGPDNNRTLRELARYCATEGVPMYCAWGANAKPARVAEFVILMHAEGAELHCLGTTKAGAPKHPLYLKNDTEPRPWLQQ